MMSSFPALATAHLMLRLQPLNRALRAAAERQALAAERAARPELTSLCLTPEHVQAMLDRIEEMQTGRAAMAEAAMLTAEEKDAEADLRAQVRSNPRSLPLDTLEFELGLTAFEVEAILLCAASELDRTYGRVFGFILDDLNRRAPCVEMLATLTAVSVEDAMGRRHLLGSAGRLRRYRILLRAGDAQSELSQELRLAPGVFDFLAGHEADILALCRDGAEVRTPQAIEPPPQIGGSEFTHLCQALEHRAVSILGIWGPRQNGVEEMVGALSSALGRPLRRLAVSELERGGEAGAALLDQLRIASSLGAILWLDTAELRDPARDRLQQLLGEMLPSSPAPVLLTGEQPWRPLPILRSGNDSEIELGEVDSPGREKLWAECFPELSTPAVADLAARFSLSGPDIRSVSDLARVRAAIAGNGAPDAVNNHVERACAVITRRSGAHFADIIQPRRGPSDLILSAQLHSQVLEVAAFFRLRNQVDRNWGFGRLVNGGGMKALFTGDPGTGKTLAAEVICTILGLPLYRVDLAQIASKWVGETERNLECAFREAEESQAVLFFDEAEALFGKRAEVQHGADRYANLEVCYLLQRLESNRSNGLVILASNVKDQIDPAFSRRFHVTIHFPKPDFGERLRIWRLAFPPAAPLEAAVDFEALAQLDMTGAAIVAAARTSALLAAESGLAAIGMAQIVRAAARQFRREARVLTPVELGPYAALLQGGS